MDSYYIYALINEAGHIFYVGVTKDLHTRILAHINTYPQFKDYYIVDGIQATKKQAFLLEKKWIISFFNAGYPLVNKNSIRQSFAKRKTMPVHIGRDIMQMIREFIKENGGNIKIVLEMAAEWTMGDGKESYIRSLEKC